MCDREIELMSAYLAGDEHAFGELFRMYAPVLIRFFMRHGKRRSDAQDLTQDTFLQLHRARADFRAGEPLRPWLFTIARNRCHDHSRRVRRRPEASCEVDHYEAPQAEHENQTLIVAERSHALHAALAKLPVPERRLLDEHWFGERAFAEIAARDGVQSSTVRVRAFRACQRLREMISVRHSAVA
jgi:RNA polymerase sigma-70 factor (ECF subfamily)